MKKGKKKGELAIEKQKHQAMQERFDAIKELGKGKKVEVNAWKDGEKVKVFAAPVPVFPCSVGSSHIRWLDIGAQVLCIFNRRFRVVSVVSVTSAHEGSTTQKRRVEVSDVHASGFIGLNDVFGVVEKVEPIVGMSA